VGVALLVGAIVTSAVTTYLPHETGTTNPALDVGKMALSFEPNDGQTSATTRFIARAPGSTIYFSPSDVAIEVQSAAAGDGPSATGDSSLSSSSASKYQVVEASVLSPRPPKPEDLEQSRATSTTVRMQFIGANSAPEMTEADMLPGKVNYLIGSDPDQWHANLPTYAGVVYHGLYPGIDLKYEGTASNLKGTYTLAPGADPAHIRWSYEVPSTEYRVPSVMVDDNGSLQISIDKVNGTRYSVLSELAPVAWQEIDGQRRLVSAQYSVRSDGTVGFTLGAYDPSHALIIDPTLTYSTYFGGIIADQPWGMALDSSGNSYIAGYTASDNFPTINALQPAYGGQGDAFVVKFNSAGVPVYSTYLGGDYLDYGNDVAVDAAGNAYVTGWTGSTDFPLHNAFQPTYRGNWDGFVSKLSPDGSSLVYSTYLGGTSIENADGIAVDAAGNAYITGDTQSGDFPTHNAYQPQHAGTGSTDVFVTKLNASGQALIYSTFLGGSSGGETGLAITADAGGYGYITGFTTSSNFPVANAYQPNCYPGAAGCWDAFVTRFSPDGQSLVYSTYLGGNDIEYVDKGAAITTDGTGIAYVTGFSGSTNFPLINALQPYGGQIDVFLSKFSGAGALTYSTYLGGTNSDVGGAIALDFLGNIYVGGETISEDFPVVNAIQPTMGGFEDAFVTKFNANGQSLSYSTFLGGTNNREEYGIIGIGVDGSGTAYMAGSTSATDFPTTANAYQPFNNGSYDIFFAKISDPIGPTPTRTNTPAGTATPTPTVCAVGDYTITQSTGATIVPGTTLLPNSNCNDCTAPFVLPFPVQFYNQTFTQARASSNGNLQFTGDNALPFNSCLPNATYNNTIYAYWDDLFLDCLGTGGCGIYTSVSGTMPNRILNVEWRAHRNEPPVVVINFEIRLYENSNGRFDIIYGQVDNPGDTATVGVQRDTGSRVTQFSCNQGVLAQGLKLTFTLPPCQSPSQTPTPAGTGTATNTPVAMPTLAFSTYFGSWERDSIDDIGQDAAGNIYVAGTTFDFDFNYGDIMVAKFTPDCQTLLWRRVIGGTRIDYGYALAVDAAGNATVAGNVTSNDYPTLNPLQANHAGGIYDAVLTKLNPQGNTIFSTYLGGSGTDYGDGLATDEAGNVYLTGHTNSSNFPTTAGAFQTSNQGMYDGYVTKINSTGSAITWSTYLGGMYGDESHAVALDSQNNVYLTGLTVSPNFPMMNPFQSTIGDTSGDAFVTKLNSSGSALLYSTYLGGGNPPGPGEDNGQGITVDSQGYAYVTGYTQSPNFPTTPGSYQPFFRGYNDAFVTKLVPAGNALVYSTFIGGSLNPPYGDDDAYDIAVDALGQAHITGKTYSPDFPVVNAVQPTPGDVYDGFVSKLNAAGSALLYSTFLGGDYQLPDFAGEDAGAGIYIDNLGNAVIGGGTSSYNFPVVNAYQPANAGKSDGFISKIAVPGPAGTPTVTRTAPPATATVPPSTTSPTRTITAVASGTVAVSSHTATPSATGTVTVCTIQFTDVPPGSTFYTWIRCLACEGIINGYPDGTFRPNNSVTRGQLAKIVSNAAGFIEPVTGHTFQDVLPGSTFYDYVGRLASRNIVQGYPCGGPGEPCVPPTNLPYFRPNSGVTRGQTSKIVAIAANLPAPAPGTQSFEDVPPSSTFWPWIEALAAQGVISGYPCGSAGEPCVPPGNRPYFRPSVGMTRGQASKVVSSVFLPGCQVRN
jgi:hypothetical protein